MEQYLTVTALTKYIKAKLEGDKHLFSILLKGEISNFKKHSRGHLYYTLKDENAQISAIMFSRDAEKLAFTPKEGDHVLIMGRISLYEPSGTYSIQVTGMKLDGIGELYLKYEALKKELELKGYFAVEHKKSIPKFPKAIGVVTSPTGAVIEDIKHTVSRRYLLTEIHLYPALVQGPDSASSIRNQILLANQLKEVDVLIVGRGGGSIEDLWGFNEMPVIDAIFHSKIPIITAIGHETDYTLSDFVSDLRAPTPTAAAELATPNKTDLLLKIHESMDLIQYKTKQVLSDKSRDLVYLDERLERLSPTGKLDVLKEKIDRASKDLEILFAGKLINEHQKIELYQSRLKSPMDQIQRLSQRRETLEDKIFERIKTILSQKTYQFDVLRTKIQGQNPLLLMDKGFAVIKKDNKIITSALDLNIGDDVDMTFKDGTLGAKITKKVGS